MNITIPSCSENPCLPAVERKRILRKLVLAVILSSVITYSLSVSCFKPDRFIDACADWAHMHGYNGLGYNDPPLKVIMGAPGRIVSSLWRKHSSRLVVDVKFKNMQKICAKRKEALDRAFLFKEEDDFVPAFARFDGGSARIKLRLKGDEVDHLDGSKWSFRVHVKDDAQIYGLKRFSIQDPRTRGYHSEILFNETLRHVGVLCPRYSFVDVTVNGNDIGIMALEEHFSKELLEHNSRRESVVVKFDESLFWEAKEVLGDENRCFRNYKNAPIDVFASSKVLNSVSLSKDLSMARGLLRGFSEGRLSVDEVFNADMFGRFIAVAELWGAGHCLRWHNLRFYYNPIICRLEPIGFDADIQNRERGCGIVAEGEVFIEELLRDDEVFSSYSRNLAALADDVLTGDLIQELGILELRQFSILRNEFFFLQRFSFDDLLERARYFKGMTDDDLIGLRRSRPAEKPNYPQIMHVRCIEDSSGNYVEAGSAVPHIVELLDVYWSPTGGFPDIVFAGPVDMEFPVLLTPTLIGSYPTFKKIRYAPPNSPEKYRLMAKARILAQDQEYVSRCLSYSPVIESNPLSSSLPDELIKRHSFLKLEEPGVLRIKPGSRSVKGMLVVPRGYSLLAGPGVDLRFRPEAGIVSYGAIRFVGTKENPVTLRGLSKDKYWKGVLVAESGDESVLINTCIRNVSGIKKSEFGSSAGVTFYNTVVRMSDCTLSGSRAEDLLNIFNSKFILEGIEICETVSDGIDIDFSKGSIEKAVFKDIGESGGGDGVDVSGSVVAVSKVSFSNINDKAISVGEKSTVDVSDVEILNAGVGVACKDGSFTEIRRLTIKRAGIAGLMAYCKKSAYGSAFIRAHDVKFNDVNCEVRSQVGSTILVDDEKVKNEEIDVGKLYSGVMKKQESK